MTRRDPFTEIEELLERMGQEFEEFGGTLDTPGTPPGRPDARDPAVDVIEDDETVTVVADLPGFDDDDIDVELHDDALSIAATRKEEAATPVEGDESPDGDSPDDRADESGVRYHRRERRVSSVSRRVPIPAPIEWNGATASYDDGVLTVTLSKRSATGGDGHSIDIE